MCVSSLTSAIPCQSSVIHKFAKFLKMWDKTFCKHGKRNELCYRLIARNLETGCKKIDSFALVNRNILIGPVRLLFSPQTQIQFHTGRHFMKGYDHSDIFQHLWCKNIPEKDRSRHRNMNSVQMGEKFRLSLIVYFISTPTKTPNPWSSLFMK